MPRASVWPGGANLHGMLTSPVKRSTGFAIRYSGAIPLMRQPRTKSPATRSTRCEQKSAHAAGSLRTDAACSLSLPMPMS